MIEYYYFSTFTTADSSYST